jgi:hypothetical protein
VTIAALRAEMIAGHGGSFFQAAPEGIDDPGIHQGRMLEYVQLRHILVRRPGQNLQHFPVGAENTALGVDDKDSKRGAVGQKPVLFFGCAQCLFCPSTSFFEFPHSAQQFIAVIDGWITQRRILAQFYNLDC